MQANGPIMVSTQIQTKCNAVLESYYEKEQHTLKLMTSLENVIKLKCQYFLHTLDTQRLFNQVLSNQQYQFISILCGIYKIFKSICVRKNRTVKRLNCVLVKGGPLKNNQKSFWISELSSASLYQIQTIKTFLRPRYMPRLLHFLLHIINRLIILLNRLQNT